MYDSTGLKGSQIMDALEHSTRYTQAQFKDKNDNPVGSCSDFLQVSGLKFSINTKIQSSVTTTDKNTFTGVTDSAEWKILKFIKMKDGKTLTPTKLIKLLQAHIFQKADAECL